MSQEKNSSQNFNPEKTKPATDTDAARRSSATTDDLAEGSNLQVDRSLQKMNDAQKSAQKRR